jgi:hypothetical protein
MRSIRFASIVSLLLVVGLAGFVVGCGSGSQGTPETVPDGKGRQELQRKAQREARKELSTSKAGTGRGPRQGGR